MNIYRHSNQAKTGIAVISFTSNGAALSREIASLFDGCVLYRAKASDTAEAAAGVGVEVTAVSTAEAAAEAPESPATPTAVPGAEAALTEVPGAEAALTEVPGAAPVAVTTAAAVPRAVAGAEAAAAPETASLELDRSNEPSLSEWARLRFLDSSVIIFVGALGIAVRAIAPHLKHKTVDPAVICVDESGLFSISVLSGHIGGGNAIAKRVADAIGAQCVITTATDLRGIFSVDLWASEMGLHIENPDMIKRVSAALLNGNKVGVFIDGKWNGDLPQGLILADASGSQAGEGETGAAVDPHKMEVGVIVSCRSVDPFKYTLKLRPKAVALGIGCKKGTDESGIAAAVNKFFEISGFSEKSLAALASISIKQNEPGILKFCQREGIDFFTHTADELNEVKGEKFSCSDFVRKTVNVDCVCERAAAAHGTLIVGKTVFKGITLALAESDWGVEF